MMKTIFKKLRTKASPTKYSHTQTQTYTGTDMSEVGREKKGEKGGEGGRHKRKKLYEVEKQKNRGGNVAYQWKDQ